MPDSNSRRPPECGASLIPSIFDTPWKLTAALLGTAALTARVSMPVYAKELGQVPPVPVISGGVATTGDQARAALRFDIPPGPLETVLRTFEQVSGLRVLVPDRAILTLPSPGVSGTMTPERALASLLTGTAVGYRATASGVFTLELRVDAGAVEVHGNAQVVRSDKFTAPLRDTPQTVTVVPQAVIESQGATSLRDVLRNVPGITYQAGEGGGGLPGDTLTMRGFSATNDIYVDGVRETGAYSRDSFNLEQVEVVKGPASTYTGRGATGGSINLSSKKPVSTRAWNATLGGGAPAASRATVDFNQPLDADGDAAVRVNALWSDADVAGRDEVHNRSWAAAPSLAFGLHSPTRLTVSSMHLRQDNVPDYGLPWAALDAQPAVDQDNFYGLDGYDFEDISSDAGTVEASHAFSGALSLRTVGRFSHTIRDSAITAPRPPNRQLQRRNMSTSTAASQTSLSGGATTGAIRHAYTAGFELIREMTANRNSSQTTNQPPTTLYDPDPTEAPFGPMPDNAGNPSRAVTGTIGAFVFDTAHLGDAWQVNGGVRFDHADIDYDATNVATGVETRLGRNDRFVSWQAGVTYKPRQEGSIYAGASTSFNPSSEAGTTGTGLSDVPTAANNVNLEPETTFNVEAGTKWDLLSSRISVNAAVFRTEKTNARTRNLANEPFVLDGRQRVDGVELGVSGRPMTRWLLFAAGTFMRSDVVASANPAEVSGDLALVPRRSLSLWSTWDAGHGFTAGGGAQFMDNVYRNAINTLTVPSYWVFNATAAQQIDRHFTLRLNVLNAGDEQYVDRVGGGHYIPGPRRTVLLTTEVKF